MGLFSNRYVKSLISFFKYGILLAIIPPLINYAALQREIPVMSSHGLPYDVGFGQKLFLSCKGEGVPTVIMESPIGYSSDFWLPLQEKLSSLTKVCIYDRAGLGMSERPVHIPHNESDKAQVRAKMSRGQEFTIERMVEDLKRLTTSSSSQERPMMFIGSEIGSMIARFYTQIYENEVSHLVLVNPIVENLFDVENTIWKHHWYEHIVPKWNGLAMGSLIGLNRILLMLGFIKPQLSSSLLSEELINRQKHLMCNPKHLFSLVDEFMNLNETFSQMKLIRSIKQFPQNVSVTVLNGESDTLYDSLTSDYLKKAWIESRESIKQFHPNANIKYSKNFNTQSLYENSNYLHGIVSDLITNWRLNNKQDAKSVTLDTNNNKI